MFILFSNHFNIYISIFGKIISDTTTKIEYTTNLICLHTLVALTVAGVFYSQNSKTRYMNTALDFW